jgi:hypothetical protein
MRWVKAAGLAALFFVWGSQAFRISMPFYARMIPAEPRLARAGLFDFNVGIMGSTAHSDAKIYAYADFDPPLTRLHQCQVFNGDASIGYNFSKHFFMSATLPFYRVKGAWADDRQYERRGLGNLSLLAGAAFNEHRYPACDYVDCTVGTGIVLPTADSPGGAAGLPLMGALAAGIFDWLSAGIEADAILFFSPMASRQYNVHWFLKADHIMRGFSVVGGYSYSNQNTGFFPWCSELGPAWSMHTMHWTFTYDLAETNHPWLPYVQLAYDRVLSGKNVLKNSMVGLYVGCLF